MIKISIKNLLCGDTIYIKARFDIQLISTLEDMCSEIMFGFTDYQIYTTHLLRVNDLTFSRMYRYGKSGDYRYEICGTEFDGLEEFLMTFNEISDTDARIEINFCNEESDNELQIIIDQL